MPGPEGAFRGKRGPGGGGDDGRTEHDAAPRSRVGCRATSEGERSGVRSCDHVGWPPRGVASRRRRVELSLCGEPEVRDFAGSSAVTITPRAAVLPGGPCEQRMARSGGRSQEGVQNPPPLWTPQPLCPGFDHRGEHGYKTGTRARALAGMGVHSGSRETVRFPARTWPRGPASGRASTTCPSLVMKGSPVRVRASALFLSQTSASRDRRQ